MLGEVGKNSNFVYVSRFGFSSRCFQTFRLTSHPSHSAFIPTPFSSRLPLPVLLFQNKNSSFFTFNYDGLSSMWFNLLDLWHINRHTCSNQLQAFSLKTIKHSGCSLCWKIAWKQVSKTIQLRNISRWGMCENGSKAGSCHSKMLTRDSHSWKLVESRSASINFLYPMGTYDCQSCLLEDGLEAADDTFGGSVQCLYLRWTRHLKFSERKIYSVQAKFAWALSFKELTRNWLSSTTSLWSISWKVFDLTEKSSG